ncbi:hypothetical protein KC332_g8377 [Hortaea werneckii]|uniref:Uncharacterized protein n=2 Tax=Hortaea werneckii TaxID=91943 RepID=A0A3M7II43_HORWE|nr:hypothetical protein KC358_g8791 [Hortaea werneckii]OTA25381.1 hypothetical protein BTJ68_12206 [Hortaea werneckii EXF-2000]KAI6834251.1 hypothetical protein KC350_g6760 [Hortaea werneckii]KAI6926465.1 hypothetical protein KC348_g8662 [Hortaea werneckii]KAI6933765.1 hypothetical protein KC341_g8066 [Hortaea werneckii]
MAQLRRNHDRYRSLGLRGIHRRLEEFVSVFPSIVTILLTVDMFVYQYDDLVDEGYVTAEDLLRLPPVDNGRVKVQFEWFLHSRLFELLKTSQDGDGQWSIPCETPMVVFRGSPSAGSYTYKGLSLEVESDGTFGDSAFFCGY